ncbi:hypothetical protein [Polaribacter uvawellassae]|uniref:hypothetical protein n=1 Tax=Polaribacter uvawellassae TaxID=3133495 RepID=UPI00321BC854
MKKITFLFLLFLVVSSCSSIKSTQKAINSGNYDKAINTAVENLRKNKTKKGNQPYIPMLEEAYEKAYTRDLKRIDFLKKEGNAENAEAIYNLYLKLDTRQEMIKPLLPLTYPDNEYDAHFIFNDYTSDIIASKKELSNLLYDNAKALFSSTNKLDYRKAFDDLNYIEKINPNYKDTRNLIREAHEKGTDYVFVSMKNKTNQIIPKKLARDLLDFDTYGFDDLWTVYHSTQDENINYDFGLELTLKNIKISPERIKEKEFVKERTVKDGWEYLVDKNGKEVINSKGEKVKVDKMVKVKCSVYQFTQSKSAEVTGRVRYINFNTQQLLKSFPVSSGFIFEHEYATFRGDKRAITGALKDLIKLRAVQFPTNEQMVFDAGNDLKRSLKRMILRNKFRK